MPPVPAWDSYPWASKGYERLEANLACLYYAGIVGCWAGQPQNPLVLETHPVGAPLTEVRGVSSLWPSRPSEIVTFYLRLLRRVQALAKLFGMSVPHRRT